MTDEIQASGKTASSETAEKNVLTEVTRETWNTGQRSPPLSDLLLKSKPYIVVSLKRDVL